MLPVQKQPQLLPVVLPSLSPIIQQPPIARPQSPGLLPPPDESLPFDINLPSSVSDLVSSFYTLRDGISGETDMLLDSSSRHIPDLVDFERLKYYLPKASYPAAGYYPQTQLPVFENPMVFEKFDTDTLFFIFYFHQGTYQQYAIFYSTYK
jgi:CCR4-NOT transcription complex subunit 3